MFRPLQGRNENFYTLENDLEEVETSWFFIANIYLKIDF